MELLCSEAATAAAAVADELDGLEDELVARALALAGGRSEPLDVATTVPWPVLRRLDGCELSARRVSGCDPEAGALDFLGQAFAVLAVDELISGPCARNAVRRVADQMALPPGAAELVVYRRAISNHLCVSLPPDRACALVLWLLAALGPAGSASLWAIGESGSPSCLAASGGSPRSRRMRQEARAALDGVFGASSRFQSALVDRWDRPYAALVAHVPPSDASAVRRYLAEAAEALSPVLERDAILERNAEAERAIVAGGERRLVRLGFDLHDGPLQEIVALAEDLRHARAQIAVHVDEAHRARVSGRFDDLDARLGALDRGLREIAHSVRPTTALDRPLEQALRGELDALARASGIDTNLSVDADLGDLTESQRIVVYRVVQEALANVRKHSGARCASVRVSSTERLLTVAVSDDGRGFDALETAKSDRLGLAGVSERVRLLGGEVEIDSRPGLGTMVRATLVRWRPPATSAAALYAVTA